MYVFEVSGLHGAVAGEQALGFKARNRVITSLKVLFCNGYAHVPNSNAIMVLLNFNRACQRIEILTLTFKPDWFGDIISDYCSACSYPESGIFSVVHL